MAADGLVELGLADRQLRSARVGGHVGPLSAFCRAFSRGNVAGVYFRATILNEDGTSGEPIAAADGYLNLESAARDEMLKRKVLRVSFEVSEGDIVWRHLEVPDLKGMPPAGLT